MLSGTLAFLSFCPAAAQNGPTMGWSSWNTYGVNINESLIKRQADAMVSKGLKDVGFDHINIDDGFFGGRNTETGELLIHKTRFPNGLKPVADYIHSKGLKAGIYSDAGANTCGNYYNGDTQSVNVGFYNYDDRDANFYFNECGFDFVKVDFCGGDAPQNSQRLALDPQERYTAISEAIQRTGRTDVRMNVCRWNYPGTWVHDVAFSWRTTHDINNSWGSVKGILAENLYMSAYCYDGHYNDMDMLEVGRSMSTEEDKTHFGMWCIMASPLLIGCDMSNIKTTTLNLLKNTELVALNQDPLCLQAYIAKLTNECYILVKDIETLGGAKRAFAVYNSTDASKKVQVSFADLDLGGTVSLRDVFLKKDLGEFTGQYEVNVPAHGTRIYVAEAGQRLERTRYEAETAYISDYQELKNNQTEQTGIYEYASFCSAGLKAGWLGYSEQNDLQWRDVYSSEGGEYELTIGYISGENRNITVSVNGKKVKTLSVNSGGWQKVATRTLNISLEKGRNVIRLSNPTNWMPDIDYIQLKCLAPTAINAPASAPAGGDLQSPTSGQAFDLQGRKVNADDVHHDVMIVDGRKIMKE
ncbi:MAG: alpha-galactosidase [Prevotella sp.]|nr:alpha-galactosidase [Prevotella sp.]